MTVVVGENLLQLNRQYKICPEESYDTFSLKLTLCSSIFYPKITDENVIDFGNDDAYGFYESAEIPAEGIVIGPGQCILCCSQEYVRMPRGIFGVIQTKGSLARLFVSMHQTDAQIEPGYEGAITFEMKNHSPHRIRLRKFDNVAQLFLWVCTTDNAPPYNGRYGGSKLPTLKTNRKEA
jgi:dCTP deaminase